jgi:hypothetical protein
MTRKNNLAGLRFSRPASPAFHDASRWTAVEHCTRPGWRTRLGLALGRMWRAFVAWL